MARDSGLRLLLALLVSTALHLSLIYGIAVGPSRFVPPLVIVAQLATPASASLPETSARTENRRGARIAAPASVQSESESTFSATPDEPAEAGLEPVAAVTPRMDDSRLPSADVPLLIDPAWYEAKDLDSYPHPLVPVQPMYPSSVTDISGDVTLLLQVDEFGVVRELSVVTAEPAGYFEEAALRAFQLARFSPAQREGHAVRSRIVIKVRFAPRPQDEH
jgi:periplasmic protein TonB